MKQYIYRYIFSERMEWLKAGYEQEEKLYVKTRRGGSGGTEYP